jgi:tellurite resistance protein
MTIKNKIIHFPVSFYAIVMGFTGFALGLQKIKTIFILPDILVYLPLVFSCLIFLIITAMYTAKLFLSKENVRKEFNHPVKINFFPMFSISLLLLSTVFLDIDLVFSKYLWVLGTILHFLFTITIVSRWMHHDTFKIIHVTPSWFIPAVGNILIPLAGVVHGPKDLSWFFFSVGLFFWALLLVIVFYRIIFHEPLAERLLPTLFILIAPPAIGFISSYKLSGCINELGKELYFFSLFMTILLFFQFRIFKKVKFYLSSWTYAFPLAAISNASFIMYRESNISIYKYFYLFFLFVVLLLICKFSYKTCISIRKNEICVEDQP